jgi:hypothetical protein
MVLLCLCTDVSGSESIETATTGLESKLEQGFLKPSEAAKPWVYWYMT